MVVSNPNPNPLVSGLFNEYFCNEVLFLLYLFFCIHFSVPCPLCLVLCV